MSEKLQNPTLRKRPVRYTTEHYEILQVTPCSEYLGVWVVEQPDSPGRYTLEARPLHLIGAARVLTRHWEETPGRPYEYREPTQHYQVVGLDLAEGSFEVVNGCKNFSGLCRQGEDIWAAVGELEADYYDKIDWPEGHYLRREK